MSGFALHGLGYIEIAHGAGVEVENVEGLSSGGFQTIADGLFQLIQAGLAGITPQTIGGKAMRLNHETEVALTGSL